MSDCAKIRLHGFNNLAKTLSLSFYEVRHLSDEAAYENYLKDCQQRYGAEQLAQILSHTIDTIQAKALYTSSQNYEPQGASALALLAEENESQNNALDKNYSQVAHLDKSHLTIHTYPETYPSSSCYVLRIDMEVSTCGRISPLQALNYLIQTFDAEVVVFDYKVRGMTRDVHGRQYFVDQSFTQIPSQIKTQYQQDYIVSGQDYSSARLVHIRMKKIHEKTIKSNIYLNISEKGQAQVDQEIDILYKRG